jgi:hypothetical protein
MLHIIASILLYVKLSESSNNTILSLCLMQEKRIGTNDTRARSNVIDDIFVLFQKTLQDWKKMVCYYKI